MVQQLKAMTRERKAKECQCNRCGKAFTSTMRLQHHIAAEHATRTLRDIHTTRDIPHSKQSKPSHRPMTRS